ncbi:signal peptidase I [soil metagenome]
MSEKSNTSVSEEEGSHSAPETPAQPAGDDLPRRERGKSNVRAWGAVLAGAFVAALLLRVFVVEAYRIPTTSMESTLLVGDYLFVSKLHYGPRLPMTFGVPFTNRHLERPRLPYMRLPGFSTINSGDVVVFNHPPDPGPIDRRTHFIKRVIGMPGDTVAVVDKRLVVNGTAVEPGPHELQDWRVLLDDDATPEGVGIQGPPLRLREGGLRVRASRAEAARLATEPDVQSIEPYRHPAGRAVFFPPGEGNTLDDFGPMHVPARGQTVHLTDSNWRQFQATIERHEGLTARRRGDGTFEIDGEVADSYTYRQDYYFMMGDNRDDSADSRVWGFVPASHIVGKAWLVYFSWDDAAGIPRLGRFLRAIR